MAETLSHDGAPRGGFLQRIPLYARILVAMAIGAIIGTALFYSGNRLSVPVAANVRVPADLILRALKLLATPLVLLAILNAFAKTEIRGREGGRLAALLVVNTVAAIIIGMALTNVIQPGRFVPRLRAEVNTMAEGERKTLNPIDVLNKAVPENLLQPLINNDVFMLLPVTLAFGIAFRLFKNRQIAESLDDYLVVEKALGVGLSLMLTVLMWVITVVPLAVLCVVTAIVGRQGLHALAELAWFIGTVILALIVQLAYYLLRIQFQTKRSAFRVLSGVGDALITAFSTASSTVTMPLTFRNLIEKVGLRPKAASLGALVGSNFNNDGTALYEAVAALFMAQALGMNLGIGEQLLVVVTSIIASVGAAGIPEAGLVTMTLVFTSVGLPTRAIALLVSVDWFLDRCRTAINVMGDVSVATLLDAAERRDDPDGVHGDEFLIESGKIA